MSQFQNSHPNRLHGAPRMASSRGLSVWLHAFGPARCPRGRHFAAWAIVLQLSLMKKTFAFVICIAVLSVCAHSSKSPAIVFPQEAVPAEKNAAMELANHLGAALGRKIPAVAEGAAADGDAIIYIGRTKAAAANGLDFSRMAMEEFAIKAADGNVIIVGGHPRGTLYGALDFLERFAGMDWFDAWTRKIPRLDAVSWPDNLDMTDKPVFANRGVFISRLDELEVRVQFIARRRNNIFWQEEMPQHVIDRWGITPVFGSPEPAHTLYHYTKSWGPELRDALSKHPDGSIIDVLNFDGPGQICFSNRAARAKITEQLKEFIEQDRKNYPDAPPKIYSMMLNDSKTFCSCPECLARQKKYGAYSGVVLEYLNEVAAEIAKTHPEIILQFAAYLFTEIPPNGIVPAPNISVQVALSPWSSTPIRTMHPLTAPSNQKGLQNLRKWHEISKDIQIWSYWIMYDDSLGNNAGVVNIDTIADTIRRVRQYGTSLFFGECEKPEFATFHPLRVFVGSKLLWNPDQDLENLLGRFFNGYYGNGAKPMREFYDYLVSRQKEAEDLNTPDAMSRAYLDSAFFTKSEQLFDAAEKAVGKDTTALFNIVRERVPMDIARLECKNVGEPEGLPSRAEVAERLRKNFVMVVKRYYKASYHAGQIARVEKFITENTQPDKTPGLKFPLDDERFKGRTVFDITSEDFNSWRHVTKYGAHIANDPEAVDGKALCVKVNPAASAEEFNKPEIKSGIYRNGVDTSVTTFPPPTDEKYHWLKAASSYEITPSTLLWMHESWVLQQQLGPYYRSDGKCNKFDIWFSMKRQGPAYFKDSKRETGIFIDRILLVEAP